MKAIINRVFQRDCAVIISFLIFLWLVLICVITAVVGIAQTPVLKLVILITGSIVGISATTGMLAVVRHLSNNKTELYTEDISRAQLIRVTE